MVFDGSRVLPSSGVGEISNLDFAEDFAEVVEFIEYMK
jgi:hypothetical protein